MNSEKLGFNSKLIHAGGFTDPMGSATTPIFQSSTFKFRNVDHGAKCFSGEDDGYIYTRLGNPTIDELENTIAELENGFGAIATSSGMGAINTVYMTYLSAGSHIVSHEAVYGPVRTFLESHWSRFGLEYTYVNTSDLDAVRKAIRPNTKMIYSETPANPTIDISDISELAKIAHEAGIPLVIDNTFCSPYLQKPLNLGADVVVHSMTKFINGHADIVAGIIIAKDEANYKRILPVMTNFGCNMDPSQAFMVRRGLKTLGIRIDRAQENAMKIAEFLESHPKVEWIRYPGLKSHPHYELGKKQMAGPGSMMSFGLKGGFDAGKTLLNSVRLALLAVSLGGVETLIQHPASMTHSKMPRHEREMAHITDGLVRLSVGIENVEDILQDLDQALARI